MPIYFTDKLAFAAGFLSGSQAPKFVADYTQRLSGQLEQAEHDLRLFQAIADRFHNGSLAALIDKHLASSDPTFQAEGAVIRQLSQQVDSLSQASVALQGTLLQRIGYLFSGPDTDLLLATWKSFEPGIVMQSGALVSALGLALLLALAAHTVPVLMRLLGARRRPAGAGAGGVQGPVD